MSLRANPPEHGSPAPWVNRTRPHVVVVGAGFGGLATVKRLRREPVDVTLVDRHNYHLFTPLLYEVGTALLDPSEIAYPVRGILHRISNADFRLASVSAVDLEQRVVQTSAGSLDYDFLVVAAGSVNNFFGNQSAEQHSFALKDLGEALALRNQILSCFEQAAWTRDPAERARLLGFVVVGGGPTGVEFAGALNELIHLVLRKDFPRLRLDEVRIYLVEATDRILAAMAPDLQTKALARLRQVGVEVRLNAAVREVRTGEVGLSDDAVIAAATVVWTAGVKASGLASQLGQPLVRGGRISVEPTLQLPGHPEVYVIGDMVHLEQNGEALPQLAAVAMRQGKMAARNIAAGLAGKPLRPFHYPLQGWMLATIGRNSAVVQVRRLHVDGFLGWVSWLTLHLALLISFRSRILVLINWAYAYFFYDRPVRLMVRAAREPRQDD